MSLPKEGRKDRSVVGKVFPSDRFPDAIAAALHRQYGDTHGAIKAVVHVTGATERAVKNWFQAKNGPNGESLIRLPEGENRIVSGRDWPSRNPPKVYFLRCWNEDSHSRMQAHSVALLSHADR
jgi:hypothetical protein